MKNDKAEAYHKDIIQAFRQSLSPKRVLTDQDALNHYGKDWTTAYPPAPQAILFPNKTDDVQAITQIANQHKIKLVPSGGRTGLSGGACATQGEYVVSFEKMNRILDFNPVNRIIRCEAGVITENLQHHVKEQGFFYPVDFASAGSSQIGGNIATNAGGINVIRYGMTRDWVAGLTVVTGNGETLHLDKNLIKNNAGLDLKSLFIGSEGILGFITEVSLRLTLPPQDTTVFLLGLSQFEDIMHVLTDFSGALSLTAFEFFSHTALEHVIKAYDMSAPLETQSDYYALIEFESPDENVLETAMGLFDKALENEWVMDGIMSQNEGQKATLWRLREDITEAVSQYTPYKNDISVSVSKVPAFLDEVHDLLTKSYPDFEIVWFGHIGDGNVHLAILKPEDYEQSAFLTKCEEVTNTLFKLVQHYNGSISAEHGVGLLKQPYMHYQHSEVELAYMAGIKGVFDPNQIMNPGKMLKENK